MLLFEGFFGVIAFGVWIFCILDVITTPRDMVRNLPKLLWLVIVVLFAFLGSIAWLVAGHNWKQPVLSAARANGGSPRTARRPMSPDDDEEFLAGLQARADEQRRARDSRPDEAPDNPT